MSKVRVSTPSQANSKCSNREVIVLDADEPSPKVKEVWCGGILVVEILEDQPTTGARHLHTGHTEVITISSSESSGEEELKEIERSRMDKEKRPLPSPRVQLSPKRQRGNELMPLLRVHSPTGRRQGHISAGGPSFGRRKTNTPIRRRIPDAKDLVRKSIGSSPSPSDSSGDNSETSPLKFNHQIYSHGTDMNRVQRESTPPGYSHALSTGSCHARRSFFFSVPNQETSLDPGAVNHNHHHISSPLQATATCGITGSVKREFDSRDFSDCDSMSQEPPKKKSKKRLTLSKSPSRSAIYEFSPLTSPDRTPPLTSVSRSQPLPVRKTEYEPLSPLAASQTSSSKFSSIKSHHSGHHNRKAKALLVEKKSLKRTLSESSHDDSSSHEFESPPSKIRSIPSCHGVSSCKTPKHSEGPLDLKTADRSLQTLKTHKTPSSNNNSKLPRHKKSSVSSRGHGFNFSFSAHKPHNFSSSSDKESNSRTPSLSSSDETESPGVLKLEKPQDRKNTHHHPSTSRDSKGSKHRRPSTSSPHRTLSPKVTTFAERKPPRKPSLSDDSTVPSLSTRPHSEGSKERRSSFSTFHDTSSPRVKHKSRKFSSTSFSDFLLSQTGHSVRHRRNSQPGESSSSLSDELPCPDKPYQRRNSSMFHLTPNGPNSMSADTLTHGMAKMDFLLSQVEEHTSELKNSVQPLPKACPPSSKHTKTVPSKHPRPSSLSSCETSSKIPSKQREKPPSRKSSSSDIPPPTAHPSPSKSREAVPKTKSRKSSISSNESLHHRTLQHSQESPTLNPTPIESSPSLHKHKTKPRKGSLSQHGDPTQGHNIMPPDLNTLPSSPSLHKQGKPRKGSVSQYGDLTQGCVPPDLNTLPSTSSPSLHKQGKPRKGSLSQYGDLTQGCVPPDLNTLPSAACGPSTSHHSQESPIPNSTPLELSPSLHKQGKPSKGSLSQHGDPTQGHMPPDLNTLPSSPSPSLHKEGKPRKGSLSQYGDLTQGCVPPDLNTLPSAACGPSTSHHSRESPIPNSTPLELSPSLHKQGKPCKGQLSQHGDPTQGHMPPDLNTLPSTSSPSLHKQGKPCKGSLSQHGDPTQGHMPPDLNTLPSTACSPLRSKHYQESNDHKLSDDPIPFQVSQGHFSKAHTDHTDSNLSVGPSSNAPKQPSSSCGTNPPVTRDFCVANDVSRWSLCGSVPECDLLNRAEISKFSRGHLENYAESVGEGGYSHHNYLHVAKRLLAHGLYLPSNKLPQMMHVIQQCDDEPFLKRMSSLLLRDLSIRKEISLQRTEVWEVMESCLEALQSSPGCLGSKVILNYLLQLLLKDLNTHVEQPDSSLVEKVLSLQSNWSHIAKLLDIAFLLPALPSGADITGLPPLLDILLSLICLPLLTCGEIDRQDATTKLARDISIRLDRLGSNHAKCFLLEAIPSDYLREKIIDLHLERNFALHSSASNTTTLLGGSVSLAKISMLHLKRTPYQHDGIPHSLSFFLRLLTMLLKSHLQTLNCEPLITFLPPNPPTRFLVSSVPLVKQDEIQMACLDMKSHVNGLVDGLSSDTVFYNEIVDPSNWFLLELLMNITN